jgi:hypothetical protein
VSLFLCFESPVDIFTGRMVFILNKGSTAGSTLNILTVRKFSPPIGDSLANIHPYDSAVLGSAGVRSSSGEHC